MNPKVPGSFQPPEIHLIPLTLKCGAGSTKWSKVFPKSNAKSWNSSGTRIYPKKKPQNSWASIRVQSNAAGAPPDSNSTTHSKAGCRIRQIQKNRKLAFKPLSFEVIDPKAS